MDQDKRRHRELKRIIKKTGNRKLRRALARDLEGNPEDAADVEIDHGRDSSELFNGNDRDATRRSARQETEEA